MSTDDDRDVDATGLDRTFAVMLAELEDTETGLTQRQADLARQLADVDAELERIARVKAAMLGKPTRRVPASGARTAAGHKRYGEAAARIEENIRRVIEFAQGRNGDSFTAGEVADELGLSRQGIGPMLLGMVRRGELEGGLQGEDGTRLY